MQHGWKGEEIINKQEEKILRDPRNAGWYEDERCEQMEIGTFKRKADSNARIDRQE